MARPGGYLALNAKAIRRDRTEAHAWIGKVFSAVGLSIGGIDRPRAVRLRWVAIALGLATAAASMTFSDDYRSIFLPAFIAVLLSVAVIAMTFERLIAGGIPTRWGMRSCRIEVERLHELARHTTKMDLRREPGQELVTLIHSIFELEGVALFDADMHKTYQAGAGVADLENELWSIHVFESCSDDASTFLTRRVLRIGDLSIGAMLCRGKLTARAGNAISYVAAITLDRYHSHANLHRTEDARRVEELRTTVLDSLAHAYKTPLTAIRAASTGLIEMGCLSASQHELVTLIDGQANALNELSMRLIRTARLAEDEFAMRPENVKIGPLIDEVVSEFSEQLASLSINVAVLREDLSLWCDRSLLTTLLSQFVDNAGKYSIAGSTVTIDAAERAGELVVSVHSVGPVIPLADHQRIFERYFRCAISADSVAGSGIGLSVARRVAQAHGGDVWLTSDQERGTTFFASLAVLPREGQRA